MRRIITLEDLIHNAQIIGLVCLQFGDSGKGGIIHLIAPYVDVIGRGRGGANAGHTWVHNGIEFITHQLPSGVAYDKDGKISIMGQGMAINPHGLVGELKQLDRVGMTYNNLMIDENAPLVLEYHLKRDKSNTTGAGGEIGSTGQGIGPCYEDEAARISVRVRDLFNRDVLKAKILKVKERYPNIEIDVDKIIEDLKDPADKIRPFVRDASREMKYLIGSGKRVCLEGAQGGMLSIDSGLPPFITSSNTAIDGLCTGLGISANIVDLIFGLVKFPYMTRVGNGPFATEFGGVDSEKYCKGKAARGHPEETHDIFYEVNTFLGRGFDLGRIRELQRHGKLDEVDKYRKDAEEFIKANRNQVLQMINSSDSFIQGVGLRFAAFEYGATTSRPRRTGWTDAELARFAAQVNGLIGKNRKLQLVLTKVDCASGMNEFKISYGYAGPDGIKREFTRDAEEFRTYTPANLRVYPGYGSLEGISSFDELPDGLRGSIEHLERYVGTTATIISIGKDDKGKIYQLPKVA
jgi:adenylosuccinate synthase